MKQFINMRGPVIKAYKNYYAREYESANEAWESLYYGLNVYGHITSPRGLMIKETMKCDIYIMNPMNNLVYNEFRGLSPIYLAKEYFWYKSGSNKVEDAIKLSKFWGTIANDDGTVNSNYGSYIFVKEDDGKTVWDKTREILENDRDTRQAIIQIPIMPSRGSKDTPCTSSIQYTIRDNRLYSTVYMRSTDVILGFPIDIFQFTMWQIQMARELGVSLGWMRFISGNLHCYKKHWIENVGERDFKSCYYFGEILDKFSDKFLIDLINLSENKLDNIEDPLLNKMLKDKIIWK